MGEPPDRFPEKPNFCYIDFVEHKTGSFDIIIILRESVDIFRDEIDQRLLVAVAFDRLSI